MKPLLLAVALLLTACGGNDLREPSAPATFFGSKAAAPLPPPNDARASFQMGQTVTIRLDQPDLRLRKAFMQWAGQGVYTETPVYRQLPGIFILAGKPRLAGNGFLQGATPTPQYDKKGKPLKPAEVRPGHIGLVMHPDGTAGPEIILMYGMPIIACCEAPQNIRIGTITEGRLDLPNVKRGDNLINISIKP